MVGYVDDITLVVVAKHFKVAELYSYEATSGFKVWLEGTRLTLVEEKAETILITKRRTCK